MAHVGKFEFGGFTALREQRRRQRADAVTASRDCAGLEMNSEDPHSRTTAPAPRPTPFNLHITKVTRE